MRVFLVSVLACVGLVAADAQQRPPVMLSHLTWFDRSGKELGMIGPLADHGNIELSPDGSQVATAVADRALGTRDIWLYGTSGSAMTRLTSTPADENWMVWSADARRAIVNAFSADALELFDMPVNSGDMRRRLTPDGNARWPVSLSPDGRSLLYVTNSPRTGNDIWVLPMNGGAAYPFRQTAAAENWATFSPDGRYVAFSSSASGTALVYVTPFPGPGPDWEISPDTGTQTRWRQANELIYLDGTKRLMAASLRITDNQVSAASVRPLFDIDYGYGAYHAFDVSRDGQRIIVNALVVSGRGGTIVAQR